ncbi:MAG: CoA transferase [Elusimicrobia bacterium]|nr:CoA transferase [Elusimicrobiota bacterium]
MTELPGRPLGGIGIPFKGFSRLRVLDFSKLLPGPYASQVLRDMGMKVTRVELPYFGDLSREFPPKIDGVGATYWMVNQGKTVLSFDFRKPEGRKRLEKLIRSADVLLEGFRPGLMERIGLGWDAVRKLNARLVYCSLVGYPPDGPWARKAGHDLNFQAVAGLLGLGDCEQAVRFGPAQIADLSGSIAAVAGILAALVERQSTRKGRLVRVAMAEAIHSWLAIPLGHLAAGEDPSLKPQWWNGGHPFYRLYDAADGGKVAVAAVEKGFALGLLDALGLSELKELADEPMAHAPKLSYAMARVFATGTRDEWEARLEGKDVCVTGVYSLKEAAEALARIRRPVPASVPRRTRPRSRS